MENSKIAGQIGEYSVFHFLIENCKKHGGNRCFVLIPGSKDEHFAEDDAAIIRKLYPDCEAMGEKHYPDMPALDGFAKLLQEYGCDILETWDDETGTHVIWHEVKTDRDGIDKFILRPEGKKFWEIAELYIPILDKKGTGKFVAEYWQRNSRSEGWYPKYKRFTTEHDTLKDVPAKPDAHFMWYCLLVTEDAYSNKSMLVIRTSMENFISVAESCPGQQYIPLQRLWWVDDVSKVQLYEDEFKTLNAPGLNEFIKWLNDNKVQNVTPTVNVPITAVKSDNGDAVLYDIPVVSDGEVMVDIDVR